jgi:protein-tyrosine kinase
MSKMFEALTKLNGDMADVALPLIAGAGGVRISAIKQQPAPIVNSVGPPPELEIQNDDVRVQKLNVKPGSPLVVIDASSSAATEQYRIVRTRILQHDRQTKLLLISSAGPNDGKTVSAINIASVLALRDANVLLIDADLRRSGMAPVLGIPNNPGLGEVLSGRCLPENAVVRAEQNPNLYILTAGERTSNPAELLDSTRWKDLCSTVREHFDFVVVDAPPIAAVADYELLQASCDSVIVVVRPDHTDKSMCMRALGLVPEEKLLGVVVNCAFNWFLSKSHDPYNYYGPQTGNDGATA